ncbi:MAG TPA: hypothetical protein H9851_03285 [Candidatus Borkfalkia faecavium]|uniref:Uncharacterized protein n=1 Tax=Candidatus Borkfalkia faecavium TaxID=2838508 RepID=A0A9D2AU19_9FIRM|nr:hypothetical protein [Candidatus Borkfalkia faecavium]
MRKGETCRALARKVARRTGGGFSPLFLPFRGSRLINGKKIHLHPYTYKGKKEKASFFLFFVFVLNRPKFYILHFTFTIQKEILRRFAPQDDRGGGLASRGVNKKLAEIFVKFFPKKI